MGDEWEITAYEVSLWGLLLLTKAHRHAKMNLVIARGIKHIWESKMGTPSSSRIIQDVNLVLKALGIVYRENGAAVEGIADRNGHRRKVVGKEKSVRCGGARTKGEGRECELTKNMFFHSDLLKLCYLLVVRYLK